MTHLTYSHNKYNRLDTIKAMEGGDWSEVIDKQTSDAVGGPTPPPMPSTSAATDTGEITKTCTHRHQFVHASCLSQMRWGMPYAIVASAVLTSKTDFS
jgi:hypothetical protein